MFVHSSVPEEAWEDDRDDLWRLAGEAPSLRRSGRILVRLLDRVLVDSEREVEREPLGGLPWIPGVAARPWRRGAVSSANLACSRMRLPSASTSESAAARHFISRW